MDKYEPSGEWLARFKDEPATLVTAIADFWTGLQEAVIQHCDWLKAGLDKPKPPRLSSLGRLLVLWADTSANLDATPIMRIVDTLNRYHVPVFDGKDLKHLMPSVAQLERQMDEAVSVIERMDAVARARLIERPAATGAPAGRRFNHSPDFTSVCWHGESYGPFTASQAVVVRLLWDMAAAGTSVLTTKEIRLRARVEGKYPVRFDTMSKLFEDHSAWGKLIVSPVRGKYSLCNPPDPSLL